MADRGPILLQDPIEWDHPLNRGLTSCWTGLANNSGGLRLWDIAGHNHGTLTNGPTWVPGPNGFQALSFDGSNDYVDVPATAKLDISGAFTICGWVYPRSRNSSYESELVTQDKTSVGRRFRYILAGNADGGNTGKQRWIYQPSTAASVYSSSAVPLNTWSHIGVTWDGSNYLITLNGVSDGSGSTNITPTAGGTTATYLGAHEDNLSIYLFDGAMDDWRIYPTRSLSASSMFGLYEQGRRGHPDTFKRLRRRVYAVPAGGTAYTQNLTGTITLSATFAKACAKPVAGTATPSGALAKAIAQPLAGTTTPSGALAKAAAKPLSGTVTPSGATVTCATGKGLTGTVTPSGATVTKAVAKSLTGTVTPSGSLAKAVSKALSGAATLSGTLAKAAACSLVGSAVLSASLAKAVAKPIAGAVTCSGSFAATRAKSFAGTITLAGSTVVKAVTKAITGLLSLTGLFTKTSTATTVGPSVVVRRLIHVRRGVRRGESVARVIRRTQYTQRVIRGVWPMPTDPAFPLFEHVKGVNETVGYIIDFTGFPEIANGETISSMSVPAVSGLTIDSPTLLASRTDGVAAGKGYQVAISGGTVANDYTVKCYATMSGGAIREVRMLVRVR